MRTCLNCTKLTNNPKFCSLSCSAKYQSRVKKEKLQGNCLLCGKVFEKPFPNSQQKFCSRSHAITYNNKLRNNNLKKCKRCTEKVRERNSLFCSLTCSTLYRKEERIRKWLATGIVNKSGIGSKDTIREYILEDQNYQCALCPQTTTWKEKALVFVLDHIDGNSSDSSRDNVRLVCPNCNNQLDTFTSKNKGKGRFWRRQRYASGLSA